MLHLAVQGNHPNLIVYLIEKCGFNINSKDNNGRTALHWGISMNSKQAVDYLVYYNIDINIKDNNGVTITTNPEAARLTTGYQLLALRKSGSTIDSSTLDDVKLGEINTDDAGNIFSVNINGKNVNFIAKSNTDKINAGSIVKELATKCNGNGGGSPKFAQGGGNDASNITDYLAEVKAHIKGA